MVALLPSVLLLIVAQTDPAKTDPAKTEPAKPQLTQAEVQLKVYNTLMSTSSAIDACTEAYVTEYSAANGKVNLSLIVAKDGSVPKADAATTLEGARNLRPCLESVAKKWTFPPIHQDQEKLALTIVVRKGVKFQLAKPGEKPPAQQAQGAQQQDEGFVSFLPQSYGGN